MNDQPTTSGPRRGGWPKGRARKGYVKPAIAKDGDKTFAENVKKATGEAVRKVLFSPKEAEAHVERLTAHPAGKRPQPTKPQPLHKTKHGLLRDRLREGFDGDNYDTFEFATPHADRFKLDPKLVDDLAREGIALQWHVEKVMGMEQTHSMAAAQKNGWRHIAPGEIPEVNMVESDGLVLMARPMAIHRRALQQQDRDAQDVLENQRRKHQLDGIPRVTGAREARRGNFHRSEFERLDIPGRERD